MYTQVVVWIARRCLTIPFIRIGQTDRRKRFIAPPIYTYTMHHIERINAHDNCVQTNDEESPFGEFRFTCFIYAFMQFMLQRCPVNMYTKSGKSPLSRADASFIVFRHDFTSYFVLAIAVMKCWFSLCKTILPKIELIYMNKIIDNVTSEHNKLGNLENNTHFPARLLFSLPSLYIYIWFLYHFPVHI